MDTLSGKEPAFRGGLREIAPGVHAWLQPNGDWGESNAALVAGDGESLLVDTPWTPALATRMLERMRRVTRNAPIARIVNTHADGDHFWGNAEAVDAAGTAVEIVATEAAAEEMEAVAPRTLGALGRLGTGLRLAGRVPVPYLGRWSARSAGAFFDRMLGPFDFSGVRLTPATRTFSGRLELDAGGRAVELIEVGPAHTPGDLIVHVPDARTVIAADVLFIGVTPVMWLGPVENWLRAIDAVLELEPGVILPGHGPPCDAAAARLVQDYFRFVEAAARIRFAAGSSPESAAMDILLSEEFRASPFSAWSSPERIVVTLHSLKRAAAGEAGPPGALQRIRVLAEAGRVAARLQERA